MFKQYSQKLRALISVSFHSIRCMGNFQAVCKKVLLQLQLHCTIISHSQDQGSLWIQEKAQYQAFSDAKRNIMDQRGREEDGLHYSYRQDTCKKAFSTNLVAFRICKLDIQHEF